MAEFFSRADEEGLLAEADFHEGEIVENRTTSDAVGTVAETGECDDCHHSGPLDVEGRCLVYVGHLVDPEGPCHGQTECMCKCTFPPPAQPELPAAPEYDEETDAAFDNFLRTDPDIQAALEDAANERIGRALEADSLCALCQMPMSNPSIQNAIFGAHEKCLQQERRDVQLAQATWDAICNETSQGGDRPSVDIIKGAFDLLLAIHSQPPADLTPRVSRSIFPEQVPTEPCDTSTVVLSRVGRDAALNSAIAFYAFRYCLGRQTYAVADCVNYLESHWQNLKTIEQIQIQNEIRKHFKRVGKPVEAEWERVLALPLSESPKESQ